MNDIKAYLLGMLVGGGIIDDYGFRVLLPFRKWGELACNVNQLATDIVTQISNMFAQTYGFHVSFDIGNGVWILHPIETVDLSLIRNDLQSLNLPIIGKLLNDADLSVVKATLNGTTAEHFISGIFDTRGSLADSHRRFLDNAPIVSLEIPGSTKNFKFVVQLCSWLHDMDTVTDQILYNHPCQQSPSDPYYKGWKKGFKIRFLAKSYMETNSFALRAKARTVDNMSRRQTTEEQIPCESRPIKANTLCIHTDINSTDLPEEVRGKLFLHYTHICSAMGCPYAPVDKLQELARKYRCLISVLPLLYKGTQENIYETFLQLKESYADNFPIEQTNWFVYRLCESELFIPYKKLQEGIAYLLSTRLNGLRHEGNMRDILSNNRNCHLCVLSLPLRGFPLMITNESNNRAIIVSSVGTEFNNSLLNSSVSVNGIEIKVKES